MFIFILSFLSLSFSFSLSYSFSLLSFPLSFLVSNFFLTLFSFTQLLLFFRFPILSHSFQFVSFPHVFFPHLSFCLLIPCSLIFLFLSIISFFLFFSFCSFVSLFLLVSVLLFRSWRKERKMKQEASLQEALRNKISNFSLGWKTKSLESSVSKTGHNNNYMEVPRRGVIFNKLLSLDRLRLSIEFVPHWMSRILILLPYLATLTKSP